MATHHGRDSITFGVYGARDGTLSTFFNSSYLDWQHIQLDFSCIAEVAAFRPYMTRHGTSTAGNRGSQGEGFAYSLDDVHWANVTADKSTGWQNYVNLRPHAWSSLNYGWSAWLQLGAKSRIAVRAYLWRPFVSDAHLHLRMESIYYYA